MFSATQFTYDGVFSGEFGLVLADFNNESVIETSAFSPTLNAARSGTLNKFFHGGVKYDAPPQHQFSMISESAIPDFIRRDILSWLVGRNSFKELKIHQNDLEAYTYRCVFTNTEIIFVNGACHGFRVTANFDSPYARGTSTKIEIVEAGTHTVVIDNKSDIIDDYVYPTVFFKGSGISIINETDDASRAFVFSGLLNNEEVTVDNEIQHISSNLGGEKLSLFTSKKWLRLRKGKNILKIICSGEVTITCPCYTMIGF